MRRGRSIRALAVLGVASMALLGCAEGGGGTQAGGDGVDHGATKTEYQEALDEMEPVELVLQSTAPKGAPTGRRWEEYAAAVEEWSGGKISFDVAFSNAIVEPIEVDDAVMDTRIDMGSYSASSEPEEYPANSVLAELNFLGSQAPVRSMLEWHGAMLETVYATPEISDEFESRGVKLLVPAFQSGGNFLVCSSPIESAAEMQGVSVASQNPVQSRQLEALGMSPVSLAFPELFEGLQRGVADCAMASLTVAQLTGIIPAAPYFYYVDDAGWGNASGAFVMGLDRWESLPLPAQQLLHDKLDVFFDANTSSTLTNVHDALAAIEGEGGHVKQLPDGAADALRAENETILEEARGSDRVGSPDDFVDTVAGAFDKWDGVVDEIADPQDAEVDYGRFLAWYESADSDWSDYYDRLWDEVLLEQRPR